MLAFLPGSHPEHSYDWAAAAWASVATAVMFAVSTGSAPSAAQLAGAGTIWHAKYLLPPLPHEAARRAQESLHWVEPADPTQFPSVLPGLPTLRGLALKPRARPGKGPPPPAPAAAIEVPDFSTPERVYVEAELDRPVVRDPMSAAPEYPLDLEKARVEGIVAVEFVVDTLGHADSVSLRIVSVSHMEFADAVRSALPQMRFSPAELEGRHVPQRVLQVFRFILPQTATNASSTTSASANSSPHDTPLKSSGSR